MSDEQKETMVEKARFSEAEAAGWERAADREEKLDRKLAEKTRAVSKALRTRAEYIKERLDVK